MHRILSLGFFPLPEQCFLEIVPFKYLQSSLILRHGYREFLSRCILISDRWTKFLVFRYYTQYRGQFSHNKVLWVCMLYFENKTVV